MKCVRSGISFTTDIRQRVDIPVSSTTTPAITLMVVAVSLSLKPKIQGAAMSRSAANGSMAWCALSGSGPRGIGSPL
jgi:hypothetical protein